MGQRRPHSNGQLAEDMERMEIRRVLGNWRRANPSTNLANRAHETFILTPDVSRLCYI